MTTRHAEYLGVAKFPVDEWEVEGAPHMTEEDWMKLCMRVSGVDIVNLVGSDELL